MLKTYLTSQPPIKFIIIEDSVNCKGEELFNYVLENSNLTNGQKTHLFVFQGCFLRTKQKFLGKVSDFYDFTCNYGNWLLGNGENFESLINEIGHSGKCCVFIDSLAHLLFQIDFPCVYRIFNRVLNDKSDIQQIVTVLHKDLLENDEIIKLIQNLSILYIKMKENSHLSYKYRKTNLKIINQIEEYKFVNNKLNSKITETLNKEITNKLINKQENKTSEIIKPENLTTFRITLTDKDKQSKQENLILPYLPTTTNEKEGGGAINYKFDDVDDWDEEDPDDDLDI